jgi:hypothetical protein
LKQLRSFGAGFLGFRGKVAWAIAPSFINILLGYNTHLYILSFAGADAASILYQLQKVLQHLLVWGVVQRKVVS